MAGISFDGLQNLDPQLQKAFEIAVKAERKPVEKIQERRENINEKTKLLTDVLGKIENVRKGLSPFSSPFAMRELLVGADDPKVLTGTADKTLALPGKHSLEVMQLAKGSSSLSNGFPDKDQTHAGSGYITFDTADGETKEIFIDDDNSTLEKIVGIVNSSGTGVRATVVNDVKDAEAPYRLVITTTGLGEGANIEFPDFYFIDGEEELYVDTLDPAHNAKLRYEGLELETSSNEVKDLIHGVTLNLKAVSDPNRPATITVEQDIPKTSGKMKELVDNMNSVLTFIQSQQKIDEKTDTKKTLGGDYGIRMTEQRFRNALHENYLNFEGKTPVRILADLGVEFNKQGTLNFDQKKFENALAADFDAVANYLSGDGKSGLIPKLSQAITSITAAGTGVLTNEKASFQKQIERFDRDIEAKEKAAERKLISLKDKLSRTQAALEKMNSQSRAIQGMGGGGGIPGM
jgi:flagellar hook-associated protein 2